MKRFLLSVMPEETRLAVEEDGILTDYLAERTDREDLVGRIYKGVVKMLCLRSKGTLSISGSDGMPFCGGMTA